MTTIPLGPDSRVAVFISLSGKVHKSASYSWGVGTACSDRFLMGTATEALVSDIDCQHCMAHDLPGTWEVRLPDKRYKTGYRVVHKGVPSEDDAKVLAAQIGDTAIVACIEPTHEEHEHR